MRKLLTLWFLIILCFPALAMNDKSLTDDVDLKIDGKASIIIRDQSGSFYEIFRSNDLKRGLSSTFYTIRKAGASKINKLFGGETDGVTGKCDRKEFLNLSKSVTNIELQIRDINKDHFFDIWGQYVEENCETGAVITIEKEFLATKNGFEEVIDIKDKR